MSRVDPSRCPLCGEPNRCAMAADAGCRDCWCAATTIPAAVLARVPPEAVGRACVCAACARDDDDGNPTPPQR